MGDIPEELKSFLPIEVKHFHFKKRYFIYFLYKKNKLRYIGRTIRHPLQRIEGHKGKIFTDIYWVEVCRSTYMTLELELIVKYTPLYNKYGHYHARYRNQQEKRKATPKTLLT